MILACTKSSHASVHVLSSGAGRRFDRDDEHCSLRMQRFIRCKHFIQVFEGTEYGSEASVPLIGCAPPLNSNWPLLIDCTGSIYIYLPNE